MTRCVARVLLWINGVCIVALWGALTLWFFKAAIMVYNCGWHAFVSPATDYLGNEWWRPYDVPTFWIIMPLTILLSIAGLGRIRRRLKKSV